MRAGLASLAAVLLAAAGAAGAQSDAEAGACPLAPMGWTVKGKRGPDFDVCYYTSPKGKGFFGIYLGFHPRFNPDTGVTEPGSVGGIAVTWHVKRPEAGAMAHAREALLAPYEGDKSAAQFRAHVWVYGETPQELVAVRGAASLVRWRDRGGWRPALR